MELLGLPHGPDSSPLAGRAEGSSDIWWPLDFTSAANLPEARWHAPSSWRRRPVLLPSSLEAVAPDETSYTF